MGNLFVETDDIEVWEKEGIEQDLESTIYEESSKDSNVPLLLWFVHFLALLQKKHFLPDAALVMLLRFLSIFFKVLSQLSPQLVTFSEQFPPSLYKFHQLLGTRKGAFVRYVTCLWYTNMMTVLTKSAQVLYPSSVAIGSLIVSMHAMELY